MIIIKVKNTMEIAKKESFFARAIGELTPKLIHRKVQEGIIQGIQESFREKGIEADFTIENDFEKPGRN